jgi:3-oxoacyl-[acyl-carrier protein] reductase
MQKTSGGKLTGRVAAITGAGQGIGRALALKLAAEGASVLANDLDETALETLVSEIESSGGRCLPFPGDITGESFGDSMVATCLERLGDLHILVNNAGYVWNSRIANHTDEQWYAMMDVHATAPFRLLRAAGRYFREAHKAGEAQDTRKVVNVSSISGLYGADTQFSYAAAKAAQVGMTRSLAKDWGRYNVTVNCVAFGHIETRLTQAYRDEIPEIEIGGRRHKVGIPGAGIDMQNSITPLGRPGTADDAAGAIYLFCIPESDFITGEIVLASGGLRG